MSLQSLRLGRGVAVAGGGLGVAATWTLTGTEVAAGAAASSAGFDVIARLAPTAIRKATTGTATMSSFSVGVSRRPGTLIPPSRAGKKWARPRRALGPGPCSAQALRAWTTRRVVYSWMALWKVPEQVISVMSAAPEATIEPQSASGGRSAT